MFTSVVEESTSTVGIITITITTIVI